MFIFPILVGKGTEFRRVGNIIIDAPLKRGLVQIGLMRLITDSSHNHSIINNLGTIIIKGKVMFGTGSHIHVDKNGYLQIGEGTNINSNNVIICTQSILIGARCWFSWNCQITDSDMHYIKDLNSMVVNDKSKPVIIKDDVWVGNRCIISKGTILQDNSIVGANSFVNKEFKQSYIIIGGYPAKLIKENCKRVFLSEDEKYWNSVYNHE